MAGHPARPGGAAARLSAPSRGTVLRLGPAAAARTPPGAARRKPPEVDGDGEPEWTPSPQDSFDGRLSFFAGSWWDDGAAPAAQEDRLQHPAAASHGGDPAAAAELHQAYGGSSSSGARRAAASAAGLAASPAQRRAAAAAWGESPSSGAGAGSGDPVHAALVRLADTYPLLHRFQRINRGFYQLEGHGSCEVSLARTGDKLLVQLDGWNRGVRGELCKFLQSVAAADVHRASGRQARGSGDSGLRSSAGLAGRSPGAAGFSPADRRSTLRKTSLPGTAKAAAGRGAGPTGQAAARGAPAPGRSPERPSQAHAELLEQCREGAVLVHVAEPLPGEPVVLLQNADPLAEVGQRLRARLLCSGRVAEVTPTALAPLELWPRCASSSTSALAAFEELFFTGGVEELDEASAIFGRVELSELTPQALADLVAECWPRGCAAPVRGLAWALRPFFADWLQRRQRLRLFSQLVVTLPDEEPGVCEGPEASGAAPGIRAALLDVTERDLLAAMLLGTPPAQRSRLYTLAAQTAAPLPLAFPAARCPCPSRPPSGGGLTDRTPLCLDEGVGVHWDAFAALLAQRSRPLLLSLGALGCAQAGKSALLGELLGLDTACVHGAEPDARGRRSPLASPAHAPGVDLLRAEAAPLGWVADVHGCALGDPIWAALMSTLLAAASVVLLHVSPDDFVPEGGGPAAAATHASPPQAPARRGTVRGGSKLPSPRQSAPAAAAPERRPRRLVARPELLATLCMAARCRPPGAAAPRVLVLLRDAGQEPGRSALLAGARPCLEGALGGGLCDVCPVERLEGLTGGRRQLALAAAREGLRRQLAALGEAGDGVAMPELAALKEAFDHFYDRLTLAGELPVPPPAEWSPPPSAGQTLAALLDQAEALAGGGLLDHAFPAARSAARLARLRAKERQMLDGESTDDARIAELASELHEVEKDRRALLSRPLSAPVRFFAEVLLAEPRLSHARVADLSQRLAAWREPRLPPLLAERRALLDRRLHLGQAAAAAAAAGSEGAPAEAATGGPSEGSSPRELAAVGAALAATEQALEQLDVTLDTFWEEIAAISDLCAEMQAVGLRPHPELPDLPALRRRYAEWAWDLNQPVQLLHGSPLRCAGQFLVDILRELGANRPNELFVISVIGVQSSAKSTLLNYLFGCGFATSAGRCTRGLYCSVAEAQGKTLLILDTEGLMSLEADGGDIFDAQLALMAMACSHLVLINHKGELSRQLQDLLEVCLFAMQHLRVCRIQPRLLFVLRDQHDRSHEVHGDALRLMRRHLAEASGRLSLRLEDLISLDVGSVFLLPSAFASDLDAQTGREVRWSTDLFAREALRLRRALFGGGPAPGAGAGAAAADEAAPEFATLPDWCLHAMSVWRVLDRYGPNLLHYKSIQEIELQRELEDMAKQISSQAVHCAGGLAEQSKALLADATRRLASEPSDQVDAEFRSSLQALLERAAARSEAELERILRARRAQLPAARREEMRRKLQTPVEYQGELSRYTWALSLSEAVDRDQLRALKAHFKRTVEELWQASSQGLAEEQARGIFQREWAHFEDKCRARFEGTVKSRRQLAEEVCMVFNHVLRQHRHGDEDLQVLELVPASALLAGEAAASWEPRRVALDFLEVRNPRLLAEYARAAQRKGSGVLAGGLPPAVDEEELLARAVVPEMRRRLAPAQCLELPGGAPHMPSEDALLQAARRLNEAVAAEESRFLANLGVRLRGGKVPLLNAAHLSLRHSLLDALSAAEARRADRQWSALQSHRQRTEEEFMAMVHKRTGDARRAHMLADLFFDALAREWLDESLVSVAADIREQCLSDMPDASGAAEHAYQRAFVGRSWDEVVEYVLDVNAYLHKIFTQLFEDRKAAITRACRPQIAAQLGALFDALAAAAQRWARRAEGGRCRLSALQDTLRVLAAESRAGAATAASTTAAARDAGGGWQPWPLLSERFPVLADFEVEEPAEFVQEFSVRTAALLQEAGTGGLVAARLESALQRQQQQVWALVRGCSATCPCCGSKCDRVGAHTVHSCSHHLLPAFNGWRVAGSCEAALDACSSRKNHEAPKRSDFSEHLYQNLEEYLKAEHPDWLPFPRECGELLAEGALKAAWVNCREPLLLRYDMVDCTPAEWVAAYEEPRRKLREGAVEDAEARLTPFGYTAEAEPEDA